jgi:hypothetical protein
MIPWDDLFWREPFYGSRSIGTLVCDESSDFERGWRAVHADLSSVQA